MLVDETIMMSYGDNFTFLYPFVELSGPFGDCIVALGSVEVLALYNNCLYDTCFTLPDTTDPSICGSITTFAQQCQRAGVNIAGWRASLSVADLCGKVSVQQFDKSHWGNYLSFEFCVNCKSMYYFMHWLWCYSGMVNSKENWNEFSVVFFSLIWRGKRSREFLD